MTHKYRTCPACGAHAVQISTASVPSAQFFGDWEDENGYESIYGDESPPGDEIVGLYAHFCFECGNLVDVGIEDPRELESAKQSPEVAALLQWAKRAFSHICKVCPEKAFSGACPGHCNIIIDGSAALAPFEEGQ